MKGKTRAQRVYALHGLAEDSSPSFKTFLMLHDNVLACIERRDAKTCDAIAAAKAHPESTPYAKFYAYHLRGLK